MRGDGKINIFSFGSARVSLNFEKRDDYFRNKIITDDESCLFGYDPKRK